MGRHADLIAILLECADQERRRALQGARLNARARGQLVDGRQRHERLAGLVEPHDKPLESAACLDRYLIGGNADTSKRIHQGCARLSYPGMLNPLESAVGVV